MSKQPQKRYRTYSQDTKCSVKDCNRRADYEVYLYDYYDYIQEGEEFFEQDFTCPFLCEEHMYENEARAKGDRVPRGAVDYPYSNKHLAQGYTKYAPVAEVFERLVDVSPVLNQSRLLSVYSEVNRELIQHLGRHPHLLRQINPRMFEEIIAEIFRDLGFDAKVTPKTRDGGRDIHAIEHSSYGTSLYLIECKRYADTHKVGVEAVRSLYGVVQAEQATKGIIATTSTFSRDAIAFASPLRYQLSLRDFESLEVIS